MEQVTPRDRHLDHYLPFSIALTLQPHLLKELHDVLPSHIEPTDAPEVFQVRCDLPRLELRGLYLAAIWVNDLYWFDRELFLAVKGVHRDDGVKGDLGLGERGRG